MPKKKFNGYAKLEMPLGMTHPQLLSSVWESIFSEKDVRGVII